MSKVVEKQFRIIAGYFFYFDPALVRAGYFSVAMGTAGQGNLFPFLSYYFVSLFVYYLFLYPKSPLSPKMDSSWVPVDIKV